MFRIYILCLLLSLSFNLLAESECLTHSVKTLGNQKWEMKFSQTGKELSISVQGHAKGLQICAHLSYGKTIRVIGDVYHTRGGEAYFILRYQSDKQYRNGELFLKYAYHIFRRFRQTGFVSLPLEASWFIRCCFNPEHLLDATVQSNPDSSIIDKVVHKKARVPLEELLILENQSKRLVFVISRKESGAFDFKLGLSNSSGLLMNIRLDSWKKGNPIVAKNLIVNVIFPKLSGNLEAEHVNKEAMSSLLLPCFELIERQVRLEKHAQWPKFETLFQSSFKDFVQGRVSIF